MYKKNTQIRVKYSLIMKQTKGKSFRSIAYGKAGVSKSTFDRALRKDKAGKRLTFNESNVLVIYYELISESKEKLNKIKSAGDNEESDRNLE